jgi:hypothetical protein
MPRRLDESSSRTTTNLVALASFSTEQTFVRWHHARSRMKLMKCQGIFERRDQTLPNKSAADDAAGPNGRAARFPTVLEDQSWEPGRKSRSSCRMTVWPRAVQMENRNDLVVIQTRDSWVGPLMGRGRRLESALVLSALLHPSNHSFPWFPRCIESATSACTTTQSIFSFMNSSSGVGSRSNEAFPSLWEPSTARKTFGGVRSGKESWKNAQSSEVPL